MSSAISFNSQGYGIRKCLLLFKLGAIGRWARGCRSNASSVARATVDTHCRNMMQKLSIEDAHTLQALAVRKQRLWQALKKAGF